METIILSKLELHNFGVYKDTVLNFDGKSIIGILGTYSDSAERSNRAGKSLIIEAIKYNLIGKQRYSKASQMIHRGEKEMFVEAIYKDSQGKEYKIRRGVDHKSKGLLNLDWIDKSRESQEAINDLFGISKDDFELTSFFQQQDINGFMDLSPTRKTEFVMQWMNNTHWKEREELVKADISILKDKIKDNDTVIKALSANQEIEENIEIELRETKAKLKKVKQKLETSKGEAKRINEEYINLCTARKDASSKIADLDEQYERNEREIESYLEKRELKNSKRNEVIKLEKQLNSLEVEGNIKEANARLAELKSESKLLKERYTKMKANGNGLCPVLNEACDRVKFTKKDEKELADKRNEISQLINQCEEVIEDLYTKEDLERKIEKADTKYKELIDELNVKVTDKRKAIQKKIEKLEASLDNEVLDKYKELKNKWGDKIDELETLIALENNKIGTFTQKIETAKENLEKIQKLEDLNKKLRLRLENMLFVQRMFSKNGIPSAEIENAFQEVEDDINYNLKELQSGLTLMFSPDKELTKWEEICTCGFRFPKGYRKKDCEECGAERQKARKEELSLKILENGVESDFEGDSGGGKTIISFCVRIALTMLKRRQNKCKLNMLFLDEVDSALDSHLAGTITNSITKHLTRKLGYEQIIMVSHKKEIQNAIPNIIKVTKYKEHSNAEFVQ